MAAASACHLLVNLRGNPIFFSLCDEAFFLMNKDDPAELMWELCLVKKCIRALLLGVQLTVWISSNSNYIQVSLLTKHAKKKKDSESIL